MSDLYTPENNDLTFYSYNQVRAFHILEVTASVLSVVMGPIAMTLWMRMDPSRRVIFRLQLLLTLIICDFFKALFILCFSCIRLVSFNAIVTMELVRHPFCDGWGYLRETATICADLTIMTLTFHNAFMILKPQFSKIHPKYPMNFKKMVKRFGMYFLWKIEFKEIFIKDPNDVVYVNEGGVYPLRGYIAITIFVIGFLFPGLIFVHNGHYQYNFSCSAPQTPVWKRLLAGWIIRYINLISIVLVYSCIIIYLIVHFRRIEKTKRKLYHEQYSQDFSEPEPLDDVTNVTHALQKELMSLTAENNAKRSHAVMRELKSFAIYPIGYWVIWLTPTISQIHNYVDNDNPEPFALLVFVAFMVPLSCIVDCIIFFVREKPWNCTTRALARRNHNTGEIDREHFKPSFFASHASADHPSPGPDSGELKHLGPRTHTVDQGHGNNIQGLPPQLGYVHDPELAFTSISDAAKLEKLRENSMASSNFSNMKTLVGSKKTSIVPNLSVVEDDQIAGATTGDGGDDDNEMSVMSNEGDSNNSSTTNATSTVHQGVGPVDSSVDMIDFLRGY